MSDTISVEADGPERATIASSGLLRAGEATFGRFTFRVHAYRGKSFLRIFFRIFNDTDAPAQLVEEFLLRLRTPHKTGTAILAEAARRFLTGDR